MFKSRPLTFKHFLSAVFAETTSSDTNKRLFDESLCIVGLQAGNEKNNQFASILEINN